MDPEMSRTVLSKTEEELLGSLSALMRNKVEYEKAQRALAHTVLEIDQAKQEVAGVKRQVAAAEDELNTRLADHERVVDEIAQARSELQRERSKYLEFQNELIAIRNEIDQARKEIAAYIDSYHHRPHSGLRYRTPAEVRKTWDDGQRLIKTAA